MANHPFLSRLDVTRDNWRVSPLIPDFLTSCWKITVRAAVIEKTSEKIQLERLSVLPATCSILMLNTKHTAQVPVGVGIEPPLFPLHLCPSNL